MVDDDSVLTFSRPTPISDRIAFAVLGAAALMIAAYWSFIAHDSLSDLSHTDIGLLGTGLVAGISLLAVAFRGGTITVTLDRMARQLHEVAAVGPFKAIDKTFPFKDLDKPVVREDVRARCFLLEVPVKDRVAIQINAYPTREEAERVLQSVSAILEGDEPLATPVSPAVLNPMKAGNILAQGPMGPLGL